MARTGSSRRARAIVTGPAHPHGDRFSARWPYRHGRTLFFGTTGNLAVNVSLHPKLPFNIHRDFTAVGHVASTSSLIYLHPSVPPRTLSELIAYAGANPGRVNFSSSGNGRIPHLAGELLNIAAKVKTVHVAYKGTAPAFNALLGGEVQFMVSQS